VAYCFLAYRKNMFYIAFKMLVGERGKYLGIILGISFASLIMTQQPSIFIGILTRTYSFITDISLPDIWVMDPKVQYIDDSKPLPSTQLYRVAGVDGVEWAKPLLKTTIQARLPNGAFQACNLIGIDDATLIGGPAEMHEGKVENLRRSDSVIVNLEGARDKLAAPPPFPGGKKEPLKIGQTLELNDHAVVNVGIAVTTRTFQSLPVIYTTYSRAIQYTPPQRNLLSFILVKAKPGEDLKALTKRITERTKLAAYTRDEFITNSVKYYLKNTALPINFGISVLLGFLVGAAIAGQTFYNFTMENLRYFGVLKAMGTSQRVLFCMILLQAAIVGSIGYGLGLGATSLFAWLTYNSVLAFRFTWQLYIFSLIGVMLICGFAAFLSIRKVFKLEAAVVFKG
jgi:putative ABC transport system permease protein